ncbi:1,4-alpha-glucan branching protein GlgB [Anaerovorax odorimutans]|uniref:1,4-alpha-glucan branching enzyme GlgB n=1 Tax=Anaerovorax odorimutans TaxID=109327 RepID=A0ABT1RT04_9FIRM|nr:1,4-alpha-glucan branching protein GlgB [Anaerovorax odorimutans]MCQ4638318.1 1,4-alpha-glucan branching protein GlgB [Anaerovorax odorimutans]
MTQRSTLDEKDLARFEKGGSFRCYENFGAHKERRCGKNGYRFALWAPHAKSVRVTGDFDDWQGRTFFMEETSAKGVWEAFVPCAREGMLYKYLIETSAGQYLYKADPFAFFAEKRPGTASRLTDLSYAWSDDGWMKARKNQSHFQKPMNIYEVHLGSWKQKPRAKDSQEPEFYAYRQLAKELTSYVRDMGYTHVELMPVMEHPFDGSWGYQITGYYAPTSRYGSPRDFKYLIDCLHRAGIGVILDWVPGHFCRDAHGLCRFNGSKLYESEEHAEWGTFNFDYSRPQVVSFLVSSAVFWLEEYHVDGLRVDGVSSLLYLNYGIDDPSQKKYNAQGGEENLHAKAFLQKLNETIGRLFPDVFTIAEESTAWPLVTYPPGEGGLGFHYKWDMGWMNDTLKYCALDFPFREGGHDLLTFSMMYAFNENFILPLSHDEVVHGKRSLIGRMPGDYWRQFAGLRLLLLYQMCHSGAKLNFMGNEFGQFIEWRFYEGLEWFLLDYEAHAKHLRFVKALNHCYLEQTPLWEQNYTWSGYEWIDADNRRQSILVFRRQGKDPENFSVILLNFRPHTYEAFRIGVPEPGTYREIFNSDAAEFGGSGHINPGPLQSAKGEYHGQKQHIEVSVPPVGGMILSFCPQRKGPAKSKEDTNNYVFGKRGF